MGTWRHHSLRLVAVVLLAAVVAGCVTTVRPPATPVEPVEVYLLDHGRTPSLVLPAAGGGMTRYAYGDWSWYALGRKSSGSAVSALFRPTPAALGRQELGGPQEVGTVRAAVFVEIEAVHPFAVEREQAAALAARLEELFRLRADTSTPNPENGLDFVRHPEPYTLLHSSNRVTAAWLRELGCEVRGRALLSRWRVAPPSSR